MTEKIKNTSCACDGDCACEPKSEDDGMAGDDAAVDPAADPMADDAVPSEEEAEEVAGDDAAI